MKKWKDLEIIEQLKIDYLNLIKDSSSIEDEALISGFLTSCFGDIARAYITSKYNKSMEYLVEDILRDMLNREKLKIK